MSMKLMDLAPKANQLWHNNSGLLDVLVQSSATGVTSKVGHIRLAQVTEEMRIMGCELPLGADVILITTE